MKNGSLCMMFKVDGGLDSPVMRISSDTYKLQMTGMTELCVKQYIIQNISHAKVAAYISERMQERQKRTEVTQDRVIEELAAIAFAKATDFVQISHGNVILTDTSKLSENQIKAIAGIKEGKNGIELKLNDKEKALELLGRHLGMFKDKLEVTGLEAEQTKLDDLIRQMRGGG